jgi:hypothetical protein
VLKPALASLVRSEGLCCEEAIDNPGVLVVYLCSSGISSSSSSSSTDAAGTEQEAGS